MADFGADNLEGFRTEARTWLEANYPAELRDPKTHVDEEAVWGGRRYVNSKDPLRVWQARMGEKGWTTPTWPKDYGGGGLSAAEARVLQQELNRGGYHTPLASFGVWMLGPVLLEYANEEQKREYLPKITRGEIRWCQGYSEPGAGSDLAGLQMRCEDKGDHYLVNGQKIWTSYADQADWIFALVRTDTTKKHEGVSFLLIDMKTPGVEPKPIKLISGSSPFCETFFTDVKVPIWSGGSTAAGTSPSGCFNMSGRTSPAAWAPAAARAARPATSARSPSATSAPTRPADWPTKTCAAASPRTGCSSTPSA
jgi:alkylation response protein AidB-like acyl-CoA dehydrogenase